MRRAAVLLLSVLPGCYLEGNSGPCGNPHDWTVEIRLATADGSIGSRDANPTDESPFSMAPHDATPTRLREARARDATYGWLDGFELEVNEGRVRTTDLVLIVDGQLYAATADGTCESTPEPGTDRSLSCDVEGTIDGAPATGTVRIVRVSPGCE